MKKSILVALLVVTLALPFTGVAATLSELQDQINSLRLQILRLFAVLGLQPSSQTAQIAGALSSQPSVDLKANGLDAASVAYNARVTISWTSTGAVKCSAFGHLVPVTSGGLWNDLSNLQISGSKEIFARHQNLGFTNTLQLTMQCANASGTSARDTVTLSVKP